MKTLLRLFFAFVFAVVSLLSANLLTDNDAYAAAVFLNHEITGNRVHFWWGQITGFPNGLPYYLAIWSNEVGNCNLGANWVYRSREFTNSFGGDDIVDLPYNTYYASLYTFGGLLSQCAKVVVLPPLIPLNVTVIGNTVNF